MSTGDIISLIALVIAINGVFMGLILYVKYIKDAEFRDTVKKLQAHDTLIKNSISRLVDALFKIDTKITNNQTQCKRLLCISSIDPSVISRITQANQELADKASKPLHELSLLTDTPELRLSAGRQLSQRYGDSETLEFFKHIINTENDLILKDIFTGQMKYLKWRLRQPLTSPK